MNVEDGKNINELDSSSQIRKCSAESHHSTDGTSSVGVKRLKAAGAQKLKRYRKYWFDDGNVIIRVEDYHFRVYSALLRSKSTYFASLLSRPDIDVTQDVVEGCRVFDVDGKRRYFTALMDALFFDLSFLTEQTPLFTLSCLLRAAHRWDVPSCKAWALARLECDWPFDLETFCTDSALDKYSIGIISLARECNIATLLKPAFYRSLYRAALDINACIEDLPSGDGEYDHDVVRWDPDECMLSLDDTVRAISLQEYVTREWRALSFKPPLFNSFLSDKMVHKSQRPCDEVLERIWHPNVTESDWAYVTWDPLRNLQKLIDIHWEEKGLCEICAGKCRELWRGQRIRIWKEIDTKLEIKEATDSI